MNDGTVLSVSELPVVAGTHELIQPASFSLARGSVSALLGNNGTGKTTLFRILAGFQPVKTGSVTLLGQSLAALPGAERVRALCYVPQKLEHVPTLTVEEFLYAACAGDHMATIKTAIERCRLENLRSRLLPVLSAGELRRVLLATAYLFETPLVLLDEPTSNLDPAAQHAVVELLQGMATSGRTIFFTTHNLTGDLLIAQQVFSIYRQALHRESWKGSELPAAALQNIYGIAFERRHVSCPIVGGPLQCS